MATDAECMRAVVGTIGRRLTREEYFALSERLNAEQADLALQGLPADWLSASRSVAQAIQVEKHLAQRNLILNKKIHGDAMSFIAAARQYVDGGRALEALLVGINKNIPGGRNSIGIQQKGLQVSAMGALLADLRRQADKSDRLVKLFSEPSFELEIAKALRGEAAHEDALKIATAIDRVREDLRRQENEAGGWRGRIDGYITRQAHDALKVARAGFEKWYEYILPRLDPKTFDRQEEIKAQIRHERGQVLQQQLAAREELVVIEQSLSATAKLEKRAGARKSRAEEELDGLRQDFAHLVGRYLAVADQATQERAMLRTELERLRAKMPELARKARDAEAAVPGLIDTWNEAVGLSNRTSKAIETLDELQAKLLGYEDRLKGAVDPRDYLQRIYNHITADVWRRGEQQEFNGLLKYVGPQSLARRRGAHRELHFRTAEDSVQYMHDYGVGGVADSIMREIEGAANTIALYRGLGTNPQAMFKQLQNELTTEASETGNHALGASVSRTSLKWYLAEVMGDNRRVANPTIAAWASTIRTWQSMARLGGAMISSFSDIPTAAAELQYNGRNFLSSYGDMFKGMMRGRRSAEQRIIADLLGVGFEGWAGHVMSRFGGEAGPPGLVSRMAALSFRLNGLNWWTDAGKATAGEMIARMYAIEHGKSFGEMAKPLRERLEQYGIAEKDWNIIRQAALQDDGAGRTFLTPEGIREIPLGQLMTFGPFRDESDLLAAERAARAWRDRVAGAYSSMIADRVDHALITPGARERAWTTVGTQRGDPLGEAVRFVMQFKSFNLAMTGRVLGREIFGSGATPMSATARVAWLAFQLSVFGYLSAAAKDVLAGKNPRDPLSVDTVFASLMQGGGLGIMGDYAFGEFNRYGRSALSTAAGPTFGNVDDLMHLYAMARDPDLVERGTWGRNVSAAGLRSIISNTPYASLFWLRPALNYMAIYPMQEAIAPGYLRRMESRIQRDQKQTFWLPPSEAAR